MYILTRQNFFANILDTLEQPHLIKVQKYSRQAKYMGKKLGQSKNKEQEQKKTGM